METAMLPDRKGLKLKFAGIYIFSIALAGFILSVIIPRTTPVNTIDAKPIESNELLGNNLLNNVNVLNVQYKKLKQLDQEYARKVIESRPASELIVFNRTIVQTERDLIKKIDSLDAVAGTYIDQKSNGLLRSFTESFRLVVNDRSSIQAFKTAVSTDGNATTDQQAIFKMQTEILARNSRITALENQVRSLENTKNSTTATTPENTNNNQQNLDDLKSTINTQEKKIAALTATNASLEKEVRANSEALEQTKKSTDNSSIASKNQTAVLEQKVSELNAEIRLTQVDCSLSRVDATQIISNAKQRKAILADALNTLNTLAATGDATIKRKVAEKINKLNQVASTLRD